MLLLFLSAFHTSSASVSCSMYHKSEIERNRDLHVNHYCTVCANALMLPARTWEDILVTDDGHDSSLFLFAPNTHLDGSRSVCSISIWKVKLSSILCQL
jgi:hypothetical protein